jgi:hypothetical protein
MKGKERNSTPKTRNGRNTDKTKDCREYVRSYANNRILGCRQESESILLARRESKEKKNTSTKMPLKFTGDVINERSDRHLFSYPGTNSKALFIYKKSHNKRTKQNKHATHGTHGTHGITPRHQPCLPQVKSYSFVRPDPRYLHTGQSHTPEGEDMLPEKTNSISIWEQYVLSLVSKTTAQWIANQCSTGEQRERLIYFLDDIYDEDEPEVSGAVSVRKLVDINDDCISVPKKRLEAERAVKHTVLDRASQRLSY